jgi:hypothetical protein
MLPVGAAHLAVSPAVHEALLELARKSLQR